MKRTLVVLYLLTVISGIIGALLKIQHLGGGEILLAACVIGTLVFAVLALTEILRSPRLSVAEKVMWTIGMLFFNGITGLVYLLVGRKQVVSPV